jgi:hypothetical protein
MRRRWRASTYFRASPDLAGALAGGSVAGTKRV